MSPINATQLGIIAEQELTRRLILASNDKLEVAWISTDAETSKPIAVSSRQE